MAVPGITYTGNVDDLSYAAALFSEAILDALWEQDNLDGFVRVERLGDFASLSYDFPFRPKLAAQSLTEGVDMGYTPYTTSKVTLTVGEVGIAMAITDTLSVSDIVSDDMYIQDAAQAVRNKRTTDIAAVGATLSTESGSAGNVLTEALILAAIADLKAANVPTPYKAAIGPSQWEDIIGSIGSVITPAASGSTNARSTVNEFGAFGDSSGGLGGLYDIGWTMNTGLSTANSGVDVVGFLVHQNRALGLIEKWAVRTEMQRDATLRATETVITANYGVGVIDDTSGVKITTLAT